MVVLYLERNREYNNRALGSTLKQIHDGVDAAVEATVVGPVEQQKWPAQPKAQLAVIRNLLRTTPSDWIVKQIAAQFNGRTTQKKLDAITDSLSLKLVTALPVGTMATPPKWHKFLPLPKPLA
ncbi:MAG: hypothetical protein AAGH67_16160 [Cyanobacteria bacterium P01_H01_bin.162]